MGLLSRSWRCLLVCVLLPLVQTARADQWSLESSVRTGLEINDNQSLSQQSSGTVRNLSLSADMNAKRQMENFSTALGVNAARVTALGSSSNGQRDRTDGRVGLSQTFDTEFDKFSLNAAYSQDFNDVVKDADVALSPGQRRNTTAALNWSRPLTERLGISAQVSKNWVSYAQSVSNSSDYADTNWGGGLSYRLTEIDSVSLSLSRSDYRPKTSGNRSTTDQWSVGLSRQMSEVSSLSVSLGAYDTVRDGFSLSVVCPVNILFCDLGLAPFVVIREPIKTRSSGLQYSVSYSVELDELSSLALSANRSERPSGQGSVSLSDTVSLGLNRALSETMSGSISYNMSSSEGESNPGFASQGKSKRRSLAMSLSRQLSQDLSLGVSYQRTEGSNVGGSGSGHSNSVNVSLSYKFPTLEASSR